MSNKLAFKTSVGGQALMEGIMMRGPKKSAMAVRKPDGTLYTEETELHPRKWQKYFLVRGVFSFATSLIDGYRYLMKSADIAMEDDTIEETKFDRWVAKTFGEKGTDFLLVLSALIGGSLALVLFMILPTAIVGLLQNWIPLDGVKTILEGVLKITMLVGYMALVSQLKDIARMFAYHGAEHKTIACYEAGLPLTVENIRPCSRFHPRCGTSFLLIVLVVSILVNSVLPWGDTALRIVYKLIFLPFVLSVSYEIIKFCGRHDNFFTRLISAPGQWLQHITTNEPDDGMIECAIAAVLPVLPENPDEGKW